MKNIFSIIKLSRPLYSLIGVISVLIVITALLDLVVPFFSKLIVDQITQQLGNHSGSTQTLWLLIGASFVVSLVAVFLTAITERLGDHFAGRLRKYLTELFYHKVLSLPQSYFDSELSGKIVSQLNRGILTIERFANTATNFILPAILQSVFTVVAMAFFSKWVAFFTFLLFPLYLSISYYSTKKWGEEEQKKNKIEDGVRGRIQEVVSNMRLVKGFTNERAEYSYVSRSLTESNKIYARQSVYFHIFDFFRNLSLIVVLTVVSVIMFFGTFEGKYTLGTLVLILQLLNQARRPLFAMSFILTQVQNAEAGSKEYLQILSLPSVEDYSHKAPTELIPHPSIEFKNVSFKYKDDETVLKNISFKLGSNKKVALVGHSGAGKSTIVNLILKFYEPTHGEIYLGEKSYKTLTHQMVREHVALVFQDNELFSTTIKENVSYGRDASDKEIVSALQKANAYDFVKKLPNGIHTEIGERGVRLSGGQKQRIQIARAILKNAPILVLDEATSSLDSRSEQEVQIALEELMKDKLVLIIAHRFSTIQNVDSVLVIDGGKIVDAGSPQELASREGIYKDLLTYQVDGNKKLLESFEIY